jgi:multiple antibiotic resistance protein
MLPKLIYTGVVFMGFLSIMNPLAGISIFLGLTANEDELAIKKTALTSVVTAFIIVLIFALAGHFLLNFFGVSFTALRIAGGVLVALIGYEMLQGKQSSFSESSGDASEGSEEGSISVTPLGTPLLAGPGVIITAMNFSAGSNANLISTVIAFGVLCVITYFVFISGEKIKKMLGADALKVITRMMGLILVVIGTQMLLEGVFSAVEEFK